MKEEKFLALLKLIYFQRIREGSGEKHQQPHQLHRKYR